MSAAGLVQFLATVLTEGRAPAGSSPAPAEARAWVAEIPVELRDPLARLAAQTAARLGVDGPPPPPAPLTAGSIALAAAAQALASAGAGVDPAGLAVAEGLADVIPTARGWDLLSFHGLHTALDRSLPPASPARFAAAALVTRSPLTALLGHADPGEEARRPAFDLLFAAAESGHPLAAALARGWADAPDEAGAWRWRASLFEHLAARGSAGARDCLMDAYGHLALRCGETADDPLARAERTLRDPLPDAAALTHAAAVAAGFAPLARLRGIGAAALRARGIPADLAVRAARLATLADRAFAGAAATAPHPDPGAPDSPQPTALHPTAEETPWA